MTVELYDVFKITLYVILIIGLPILFIQLYLALKRLNYILKNAEIVSDKAIEITETEEDTKEFVSDIISMSLNDVVDTQIRRTSNLLANGLFSLTKKLKWVDK